MFEFYRNPHEPTRTGTRYELKVREVSVVRSLFFFFNNLMGKTDE
jgi:hypothetical protein